MPTIQTSITHANETYLPDVFDVGPPDVNVPGYGYNEGDNEADIVSFTGTPDECGLAFMTYALRLSRIRGADDDHYDYWPSNFSGLIDIANQLRNITGSISYLLVCQHVWDDCAHDRDNDPEDFQSEIHSRPEIVR